MAGNAGTVYRFLLGKGLTPQQAAGVVGGLSGESGAGLSTTAQNPSSGAYGIGQWLGGRKSALLKLKNPQSLSTQLNYLWSELQGSERGAFQAVRSARSIDEATRAWVSQYERPEASGYHLDQRTAVGRQVFNQMRGVKGVPSVGGEGVPGSRVTVSGGGSSTPGLPAAQTTNALLEALASQRPQIQSAGIAPPAFAAGPAMPKGYQAPQSAGVQSTAPNIAELASLVQPTDTSSQGTSSPGASASFTTSGANAAPGGTIAGSGRYPTARSGKLIGVPYQGTHTLGNWQSDNAVDIAVPIGTPMLALQDGVVVKVTKHPQGSGRFAGDQITIRGANGNEYFYGHGVAGVRPGQRISKGQELGTTGAANGVAHLHFGQMKGDPREHTAFR